LGRCYRNGHGVAKDEGEAFAYFSLAGITYDDARKELAILEKGMSPDARLRGQQRTKELQKAIEAKIAAKKAEDVKKAGK
jgi:TPR repeat protein